MKRTLLFFKLTMLNTNLLIDRIVFQLPSFKSKNYSGLIICLVLSGIIFSNTGNAQTLRVRAGWETDDILGSWSASNLNNVSTKIDLPRTKTSYRYADASTGGSNRRFTSGSFVRVQNAYYHGIAWVRVNQTGITAGIGWGGAASTWPIALTQNVYTQIYNTSAPAGSNGNWTFNPTFNHSAATTFFIDDAIVYESTNPVIDLASPNTPTAFSGAVSAGNALLNWNTGGDDAGAGATGVQATLILQYIGALSSPAAPVLHNQASYVVNDIINTDWKVVKIDGTATGSNVNIGAISSNTIYAAYHRDFAYNWSPATTTTVTVCTPPAIITQPAISPSATTNPGTSRTITINVSNSLGTPTYVWQYYDGTTWNTASTLPAGYTYGGVNTQTLTVNVPAYPTGVAGTYNYRCLATAAGCTITSNTAVLTVQYPQHTLTSINPTTVDNTSDFTLDVYGTNFINGISKIQWQGADITTTFIDATHLRATITTSPYLNTTGNKTISVNTPGTPTPIITPGLTLTVTSASSRVCSQAGSAFTIDNSVGQTNTGTNFTSFTAAINDLNLCTPLTKNVVFTVKSGNIFPENLLPAINVNTASFTVTFVKSSTAHAIIQAQTSGIGNADAIVTVNGTSTNRITFDGIDLINNTGTAVQKAEIGFSFTTSNATNNAVRNSVISGIEGSLSNTYGIYAVIQSGMTINNVTVKNMIQSGPTFVAYGIYLTPTATGTTSVYSNDIHDIANTSTGDDAAASYGIYIAPVAGSVINIYNNFISQVNNTGGDSSPGGNLRTAGINLTVPSSGANVVANVYFNSVYLSGTYNFNTVDFYTTGTNLTLNLRNNIFKFGGTQNDNKAYCVYFNSTITLTACDYNIYDMRSPMGSTYITGRYAGGDRSILAAFKTSTGQDANSKQFAIGFKSTSNLHLAVVPDANYNAYPLGSPYLQDIDGDTRGTDLPPAGTSIPVVGADEVPRTLPVISIETLHPTANNIAAGTNNLIIGQFKVTASNTSADLSSIAFRLAGNYGGTDVSNFEIWYNSSENSLATASLLKSIPGVPGAGVTTTATSLSLNLDVADFYYFYIICDVSGSAPAGTQIMIDQGSVSDFVFVNDATVTKFGTDPLAEGGLQTVCAFYYNSAMQVNGDQGGYTQTTDITDPLGWRANKDGAGGPPGNLALNNSVYNVIYNGATFTGAALNITGTNSSLQVGEGTAVTLTVPAAKTITATVDVKNNASLILQNAITAGSTMNLRTLDDNSTVDYAAATGNDQYILAKNYGNLKITSTAVKTLSATGTIGVARLFTATAGSVVVTNSTVAFNGAVVAQKIPQFSFENLVIQNNTATATLLDGTTTVNKTLNVKKNLTIDQLVPRKKMIIASTGTGVTVNPGIILNISGDFVNYATGNIFTTDATNTFVNSGGIYELATAATGGSTIAAIPIANWYKPATLAGIASKLLITGIVGPGSGGDYSGLSANYQAFGDVEINCPNLTGKLLLTNATSGGFSANRLLVINTGTATASKVGVLQISREGVQKSVYVKEYYQSSGIAVVTENSSSETQYRSLNVENDFTVKDSLPGSGVGQYSSVFRIAQANLKGATAVDGDASFYGYLRVGGNFHMYPTTKLEKKSDTYEGAAYHEICTSNIVFNGSTGNQIAIFPPSANVTGIHHIEINKATPSASAPYSNDAVMLQNNDLTMTNCRLTSGKFVVSSGLTFTINGLISYGYYPSGPADINLLYNYSNYNTTGSLGKGTLSGTSSSRLTLGYAGNAGELRFTTDRVNTATNVNIPSAHVFKTLTLNTGVTAGIAKLHCNDIDSYTGIDSNALILTDSLLLSGNAYLSTNDRLTLSSTASKTAMVAPITSGTINGGVCVERYIPNSRKWRLLSSDMFSNTDLTIKNAWQDSVNNTTFVGPWTGPGAINQLKRAGYSTHITKGNNNGLGGYDNSPWQPSILAAVSNADASLIFGTKTNNNIATTDNLALDGKFNNRHGYMLFVRGDRTIYLPLAIAAGNSITTLRPVGTLRTGPWNVNGDPASLSVVGNPYASAVNYANVVSHSTITVKDYYVLDPNAGGTGGTGAFVLMEHNSATNTFKNLRTNTTADGVLQSGQAILIYPNSGAVNFTETDKVSSHNLAFFRPTDGTATENLRAVLNVIDPGGELAYCDVNETDYNSSYKNEVDLTEDLQKLHNFSENFAIYHKKENAYLIVERRKPVTGADTVFFRIYGMKQKTYSLDFVTTQMDHPNLNGFLEDLYLKTKTPVSLNGSTHYQFTIGDAASRNADRFRLVFANVESGPLPVTFTNVKAFQANDDVQVEWLVNNQVNIKEYQVEASIDGRSFVTKATIAATGVNGTDANYSWLDVNPLTGDNFYRIRSIDQNGKVQYTQIVKVNIGTLLKGMLVYPNPVRNGSIGLQMNNMPEGKYNIRVTNIAGQLMFSALINRSAGSSTETIKMNEAAAKGTYNLEIIAPDKTKTVLKFINQ